MKKGIQIPRFKKLNKFETTDSFTLRQSSAAINIYHSFCCQTIFPLFIAKHRLDIKN